jgi:4-hydroxyphenylacetate 3-monooxygenase
MWNARGTGALDKMIGLAEACMADYDERGWTDPVWLNPDDVADKGSRAASSSSRAKKGKARRR